MANQAFSRLQIPLIQAEKTRKLLGVVAFFSGSVLCFQGVLTFFLINNLLLSSFLMGCGLFVFGVYGLNQKGKFYLARNLLLGIGNLLMYALGSMLATGTDIYTVFFLAVAFPFLLYSPFERRIMWAWVIVPALIQMALFAEIPLFIPKITLGENMVQLFSWLNYLAVLIVLVIILYYFFRENARQVLRITQAMKEVEQVSKARTEFLSIMSHEIRTPLNAIIGMSGLLTDSALNEEQEDIAQTIRMSGESLLTIINDILDFSKIESGKFEMEHESFELRQPIEDALELVAPKAGTKSLELVYEIDSAVPQWVRGDITRLRQILLNLISNAVKFTEAGEVSVNVTLIERTEHQTCLSFAVTDTGIGIPADRIDRLFQSFSQVDASTTRKYGGTGLGLAITKRLVELMGGKIKVESQEGSGSTFSFTICLPETEPSEIRQHALNLLQGKRVLLVDDHPINLDLFERQLKVWGFDTVTASSGQEGLAKIAQQTFDLAILDMQMPEMDGVELATSIRKTHQGHTLPLILLSSIADNLSQEEKALFAVRLAKPVRLAQLLKSLFKVLQPSPQDAKEDESPQQPLWQIHKLKPLRILLAEDNLVNQKVALRMLGKLGYQADLACNGQEALDAALKIGYDLILMDMQMPVMDGIEATRNIHAEFALRPKVAPIIIAMTANAMQEAQETCQAAGMQDFVPKPVRLEQLEEVLYRWHQVIASPQEV